jgi:hypothetical protein
VAAYLLTRNAIMALLYTVHVYTEICGGYARKSYTSCFTIL